MLTEFEINLSRDPYSERLDHNGSQLASVWQVQCGMRPGVVHAVVWAHCEWEVSIHNRILHESSRLRRHSDAGGTTRVRISALELQNLTC
eukprot:4021790-Prymnesium_polylepis.1